jgi:NitT/TauT family transport system substrate-binding protein
MQRSPVAFLMMALMLVSCHSVQPKKVEITFLTLKGASAMGMIYLIDSQDQVIPGKMHIEIIDEPMLMRARMLRDEPELAVLPLNMAAILYNKGLAYQVIAIPVWGTLYLFGSDTSINGWESLRNKRISLMGKGTTPDVLFRYLLNLHGIKPDQDVILDYSFPTHIDLANAVSAGQVRLAVISEPLVSLVRARTPSVRQMMDLNSEWAKAFPEYPAMPQTALIGRTDFIRDHPDWITGICQAWARSIEQVVQYPEQAAGRIVFHKILPDPAIAVNSIPGCNLKFRYAYEIKPEIRQFLQVFFTFNPDAVGGKLPDEKFICQKPDY